MKQRKIFHLLQRAHSALFRAADQNLKKHFDLTATQQAVLFQLIVKNGLAISIIAENLKMGKSSLTALIDRMSTRGLVRRVRNASDGRSYEIEITPKGRALCEISLPITLQVNNQLLAPFSEQEQETIEKFLKYVADFSADAMDLEVHATVL
ncbi:MAG: MarR family transcriptional regulator [Sneathiella sp.]